MTFLLLYTSEATVPLSALELDELVGDARVTNRASDVTGVLVHRRGSFLQVLEGDEPVVRELYRRIIRDPRHHDVRTLWSRPVQQRRFDDWSMAFSDLDHGDHPHSGLRDAVLALTGSITLLESDGYVDDVLTMLRDDLTAAA